MSDIGVITTTLIFLLQGLMVTEKSAVARMPDSLSRGRSYLQKKVTTSAASKQWKRYARRSSRQISHFLNTAGRTYFSASLTSEQACPMGKARETFFEII